MSARTRLFVALPMIALIGIPTLALTLAQPPAESLPTLELPDSFSPGEARRPQPDAEVLRQISEAIREGRSKTGNPQVDEVLEFRQSTESVLANSSLDPAKAPPEQRAEAPPAEARAAECLLRAARILEKIEPTDKTRLDLVNRMRRESVRLLTQ